VIDDSVFRLEFIAVRCAHVYIRTTTIAAASSFRMRGSRTIVFPNNAAPRDCRQTETSNRPPSKRLRDTSARSRPFAARNPDAIFLDNRFFILRAVEMSFRDCARRGGSEPVRPARLSRRSVEKLICIDVGTLRCFQNALL